MKTFWSVKSGILLTSTSLISISATAILGFILAGVLSYEDFGITRVVSAYIVVLSVLGTFAVHDALASHIAKTHDLNSRRSYFLAATLLVVAISTVVSSIFIGYVYLAPQYDIELARVLIIVSLSLPLICLSITYSASLQAIGGHSAYALITVATGVFPLLLIIPSSVLFDLSGWTLARVVTNICLFCLALFVIRGYLSLTSVIEVLTALRSLWRFSRLQIVSGVFSLVMLSADVVALEWLTSDLMQVANYGLALLFVKAFIILSSILGKLYFRRLAAVVPNTSAVVVVRNFLILNQLLALVAVAVLVVICPNIIGLLYEEKYSAAELLLLPMSFGLFFNFAWNAISVVNIAHANTLSSMLVSVTGSLTSAVLLLIWIPSWGAVGAVWAMNTGFLVGASVGLFMLARRGYLFK